VALTAATAATTVAVTIVVSAAPAIATSPAKAKVKKITVTSAAFGNNQSIPIAFTCDGASASPPLQYTGVPKSARDRALIMADPDAPTGTIVHWVAWHLPKRGLPEQSVRARIVQGTNTLGKQAYAGPCPPPGTAPHHYTFTVYAVSKPIDLAPGASVDDLRAALKGKVVGQGALIGTYQRA
jgi:Raf kinase inhibitor-like YbhB/YbcL family protein